MKKFRRILLALLLFQGGFVSLTAQSNPNLATGELPKFAQYKQGNDLYTHFLVPDWNLLTDEQKFWFIRGFDMATWTWANLVGEDLKAFHWLFNFFPNSEEALSGYLDLISTEYVWQNKPLYLALSVGVEQFKVNNGLPLNIPR